MELKLITKQELLNDYYDKLPRNHIIGVLFTGDRLRINNAVVAVENNEFKGLATISFNGGWGKPEVVGVYVFPEYRHQGVGFAVTKYAIEFLINDKKFAIVTVQSFSTKMLQILDNMPPDIKSKLEIINLGGFFDLYPE